MNDDEFIKVNTETKENTGINSSISKNMKIAFTVLCGILVVVASYAGFNFASNMCKVPNNLITSDNPESVFSISLVDGKISMVPEKIATKLRTATAEYNVDNNGNHVYSVDIFDDYFYETLFNDTMLKQYECYIGNKVQRLGAYDEKDILNILDSEDFNDETVRTKGENEYANVQSISSLYKEGYIYKSGYYINSDSADEDDFSKHKNSIVSDLKYNSDNKINIDKKVNFDGFGLLSFNDLDVFTGKYGIMYSLHNGLVSVFDEDKESTVLFITNMNNKSLQNSPMRLIPIDKYKNVYVDFGWRNKADWGYGSFAVMTNSGMYYFKISEAVDNPEEFAQKVIDWLGVKPDDEYIDTGYEFKLTIDNLRDTLENEELKAKENETTVEEQDIVKD